MFFHGLSNLYTIPIQYSWVEDHKLSNWTRAFSIATLDNLLEDESVHTWISCVSGTIIWQLDTLSCGFGSRYFRVYQPSPPRFDWVHISHAPSWIKYNMYCPLYINIVILWCSPSILSVLCFLVFRKYYIYWSFLSTKHGQEHWGHFLFIWHIEIIMLHLEVSVNHNLKHY